MNKEYQKIIDYKNKMIQHIAYSIKEDLYVFSSSLAILTLFIIDKDHKDLPELNQSQLQQVKILMNRKETLEAFEKEYIKEIYDLSLKGRITKEMNREIVKRIADRLNEQYQVSPLYEIESILTSPIDLEKLNQYLQEL